MSEADRLLQYSEWLDGEHLIVPDRGTADEDTRTHDELVRDFLARHPVAA